MKALVYEGPHNMPICDYPHSHLEMACGVTDSSAASASCVRFLAMRSSRIFFPISMFVSSVQSRAALRSGYSIPHAAQKGKRRGSGSAQPAGESAAVEQTALDIRRALHGHELVASRLERAAQGILRDLLGRDEHGLALAVRRADLLQREGRAQRVVDVALAHTALHTVDLQCHLYHRNCLHFRLVFSNPRFKKAGRL